MTLTIEINDPVLLRKASQLARRDKAKDEAAHLQELFIKATRQALGMDADLSPSEAAQRLQCHKNTVLNYHADGKFPNSYFRSARSLRIPVADVDALKKRKARITS